MILVVTLKDYPAVTLKVPFTTYLVSLEPQPTANYLYNIANSTLEMQNTCKVTPAELGLAV